MTTPPSVTRPDVGRLQLVDAAKERALARAARPDDRDNLACAHAEIDAGQHFMFPEFLVNGVETQQGVIIRRLDRMRALQDITDAHSGSSLRRRSGRRRLGSRRVQHLLDSAADLHRPRPREPTSLRERYMHWACHKRRCEAVVGDEVQYRDDDDMVVDGAHLVENSTDTQGSAIDRCDLRRDGAGDRRNASGWSARGRSMTPKGRERRLAATVLRI